MLVKISRKLKLLRNILHLSRFRNNPRVYICPELRRNLLLEVISTRFVNLRRFRRLPDDNIMKGFLNKVTSGYFDDSTGKFQGDRFILDLPSFTNARGVLLNDYRELFFNNVYFKCMPFGQNLQDGTILDCGANVGAFGIFAATRSDNVKVECFEPHPTISKALSHNIELNGLENRVKVHPLCLSDERGELALDFDEDCFTMTKVSKSGTIKVKANTIDNFVKENGIQNVNLIKMDIEGAERFALEGARQTIKRFTPALTISAYHLPDDVPVLVDLVLDLSPKYQVIVTRDKHLYAFSHDSVTQKS